MDAVTYPAKEVQEMARSFVVVRIEVDQNKELAKKYGVKSLTDIRLLDPDGKELDKLVGFTSAAKLAARGREALDRLAGKAVAERKSGAGFAARAAVVTPEAVNSAVQKGLSYLRTAFKKGWPAAEGFSPDELVLFAWAASGLDPKDEDLAVLRNR